MTLEQMREFLGWCSIINIGLLFWWLFFITLAHDWTHRMHSRFFQLSSEQFDRLHYGLMGFYKILIFVFNIIPYIALSIIG